MVSIFLEVFKKSFEFFFYRCATLLIFFFNWSFAGDMTNYTLEEVENESHDEEQRLSSNHEIPLEALSMHVKVSDT